MSAGDTDAADDIDLQITQQADEQDDAAEFSVFLERSAGQTSGAGSSGSSCCGGGPGPE